MAPFHFIKIMRKRLILISEIVLLSGGCLLNAQSFSCGKWQVLDIPFQANRITGDPLAVHFGAIITHEGGKAMKVPGFYNEDNTWIIRFCPPQEGTWSYTTYSSLTDLSGNQGIVSVVVTGTPASLMSANWFIASYQVWPESGSVRFVGIARSRWVSDRRDNRPT